MEKQPQNKVNRILRNLALVFSKNDITLLDKNGYNFLYLASGFIAHYDLNGFIHAYGSASALKEDILRNQSNNQWDNFHKGERDYEYYMQKKEIYNTICGYAKGDKSFKVPKLKDTFKEFKVEKLVGLSKLNREEIIEAFSKHLFSGFYFQLSDSGRAIDLADVVMAYDALVFQMKTITADKFFDTELEFRSGNKGTPSRLLGIYHDSIWNVFNELLGIEVEEFDEFED